MHAMHVCCRSWTALKPRGQSETWSVNEQASGGSVDRIPIIALSAVAEEESIKAFRDAGVCDVMSKPVAGAMLIAAINRCTSIEARAR